MSIIFTLVGTDLPGLQQSQTVTFQPGGSTIRAVNFTVTNDDTVECTEELGLNLVTLNSKRLQIDSTRGEADVTIMDDDGMFFNFFIKCILSQSNTTAVLVAFSSGTTITEGTRGSVLVGYQGTLMGQSFMVTVESYQCSGANDAIRMY